MAENTESRTWTRLQRQLHWWVAALIAIQFALQAPMRRAMAAIGRDESITFTQFLVTTLHVWGGVLALALTVYRIRQRWRRPVPVAAGRLPPVMSALVEFTHRSLLALVLLMGVSGLAHWYLHIEMAATVHGFGKWVLASLIAVHVSGALWHRVRHPSRSPS